jgi:serine/threonine-protein kinase
MDGNTYPTSATTPDPDRDAPDHSGRTLGDFQLLRLLGQGGMGQVYLARQITLKRQVAVKILKRELAGSGESLKRFQAEAEAVAGINHANIVQVYAIGEAEGLHYMALEYVEGRNLRDYLAKKGPPELPAALSVMRQIASALQRASELGFVHRDVKPENILLTRKGEAKLADFGLSRCFTSEQPLNITQSGVTMGTPLYMSPEQVHGKPVDPRSDIYSFGATCFTMLAGHPPFRGATGFEVAVQHVQAQPPELKAIRPDLPEDLCTIVHKMMAKNPADRYQSGHEILRDLSRLRGSLSAGASGGTFPQLASLSLSGTGEVAPTTAMSSSSVVATGRPRGRWLAACVVVFGGIAAGAGLHWWQHSHGSTHVDVSETTPEPEEKAAPAPVSDRDQLKERADKVVPQVSNPANFQKVFGECIEIGCSLLELRMLDEAEHFFDEVRKNARTGSGGQSFRGFAQIGHAMLLAYRDGKTDASIKEFTELFPPLPAKGLAKAKDAPALGHYALLANNAQLMSAVHSALDYNLKNLGRKRFASDSLQSVYDGSFTSRLPPRFGG